MTSPNKVAVLAAILDLPLNQVKAVKLGNVLCMTSKITSE